MGRGNNRKSRKMVQRSGQARKKARLKRLVEAKRVARKSAPKAPKVTTKTAAAKAQANSN